MKIIPLLVNHLVLSACLFLGKKYVYTHIFICKCVSIHTYIYICEYTFIPYKHILLRHITHTRTYTHIHTSMQCTHTCIYTHMHTRTHRHSRMHCPLPIFWLHKWCSFRSLFSPASYFSCRTFFSFTSKIFSDIRVCPRLCPSLDWIMGPNLTELLTEDENPFHASSTHT